MIAIGKLLFALWLAVAFLLYVAAVSRFAFPNPNERDFTRRLLLLVDRLMSSTLWPVMALSRGGRRKLTSIWKGQI